MCLVLEWGCVRVAAMQRAGAGRGNERCGSERRSARGDSRLKLDV
jgi:hypothetical protein